MYPLRLPTQGLHHRRVILIIRNERLLGPYHKSVVGFPEDSQRGTGVPYDLGDLVLGTNDRSHQSEGKRVCKASELEHY